MCNDIFLKKTHETRCCLQQPFEKPVISHRLPPQENGLVNYIIPGSPASPKQRMPGWFLG